MELDGLQNAADDSYLNAATVSVTIKDSAGVNVTGETWPKTMSYVAASNGKYRATVSDAMAIVPGRAYTAHITAEASGLTGNWQIAMLGAVRAASHVLPLVRFVFITVFLAGVVAGMMLAAVIHALT